jgi:hypothetical protein
MALDERCQVGSMPGSLPFTCEIAASFDLGESVLGKAPRLLGGDCAVHAQR